MNIKHISFLTIGILFSMFFISCNKDNDPIEYTGLTNDAQIYSFSLVAPFIPKGNSVERAQDSIRISQVNKRTYSIDQLSNLVYNQDSLPYLTTLQNVKVTATFNTTYGVSKVEIINKDTTYTWNTSDSIDFSKAPIYMRVYSWGGTQKKYYLDVRTHKIDPNLIVWSKMAPLTLTGTSKSLLYNNNIYSYILNNNNLFLNKTSKNNVSWEQTSIVGLPTNINMQSFNVANGVFNAIDKLGYSYVSNDSKNWSKVNNGYNVIAVVGVIPALSSSQTDDLLVIINQNGSRYFAKGSDLSKISEVKNVEGLVVNTIPTNFPISSISSFSNNVSSKNDRMLVVAGGKNFLNETISDRWLVKNTSNGVQITSFIQIPVFTVNPGLSIFPYNNLFYILNSRIFYTSDNKGETWAKAPAEQAVDPNMKANAYQSVIVDSDNYIWVLGGQDSKETSVNEVWKGRLNSLIP